MTLGETEEQVAEVKLLTARWVEFNQLWHEVPIPVQLVRYEDLRLQPLSLLMNLVQFILPSEELPSMERLSCALELDETHEAYHSALSSFVMHLLSGPSSLQRVPSMSTGKKRSIFSR